MATRDVHPTRAFAHLDAADCWRLVGSRGVGRIVFAGETHTEIVPTTYDALSGTAYFRTPTYGELARRVHDHAATLQVDDIDHATFTGWSVAMTGTAHRVEDAATVASLWSHGRPRAWFPAPQTQWIALPVDVIRGQRVSS